MALSLGLGLQISGKVGPSSGGSVLPATVPMDLVLNFSSTTGAATAAKLTTGTHGPLAALGEWSEQSTITHSSVVTSAARLPFDFLCDGVRYNGTEGNALEFNFATEPTLADVFQFAYFDLPRTVADSIVVILVKPETTQTEGFETTYSNDIVVQEGGNYSLIQILDNFVHERLAITHSEGSFGGILSLGETWLVIALLRDTTAAETLMFIQEVNSSTWTLGTALGMTRSATAAASFITFMRLQSYLRVANGGGKTTVKILGVREGIEDFPPWNPGALTGPTIVGANRTASEEITLSIGGPWMLIRLQRQVNGGVWADLDAVRDIALEAPAFGYVDSTVTVPNTYRYRAIGLVRDVETSATQSSVIDLSEPFAEWHDGISLGSAGNTQAFTDSNGFAVANYVTLPAGTMQKLRLYVEAITGTVSVKMALYEPLGNDALITTATVNITETGWNEFDVPDEVITADDYLVAFHLDPTAGESITVRYGTGAPSSQRFDTIAYAAFPADPHGLLQVGSANYASGVQVLPP